MAQPADYDEMGLFRDNAEEAGLPWDGPPDVRRVDTEVDGRTVSALVWGQAAPELVLIHGGGQNAHTWDTVALSLRRPLVAVDLPGHGRSDWRDDHDYGPSANADAVAAVVERLAPEARLVVGMSLGGLTAIRLAADRPDLVRRLVVVDVTPGVGGSKAAAVVTFLRGRDSFESFDDILSYTMQHNPTRSESSLRRGVLHNARQRDDGTWVWRHDLSGRAAATAATTATAEAEAAATAVGEGELRFAALWDDLSSIRVPILLVRGGASPVVDEADVAELVRRQPEARVVVVEGAGHSIQGDRPLELARLIDAELV